MKTNKIIAAVLLLGAAVACNSPKAITIDDTTYALPSKASVDSVSYLLGINFGSFIKGYNFGEASDLNFAKIEEGMKAFINAKGDQNSEDFVQQFKIDPNLMNDIFNNYLQQRNEYTSALKKQEEKDFLAANAKKSGVTVTESGLQYTIVEPGNDVHPTPQDTVFVHYKGTKPDGTVFDETPEGGQPISFPLNGVIAGWTEGLQLIGEGGKMTLVIPSELAYGTRGAGSIEPNTPLTFEVTLDKVHPYVAPVEE